MISNPVRIAVIGLDHWYTAISLAGAIAAHPEAELAGIWDADPVRAEQVAAKVGNPPVVSTPEQLLDDDQIDVAATFASVEKNPDLCVRAAEQGKHIVSIKPLARTLDEATRIVRAVQRAGVAFVPSESRTRATPFAQQLRAWVDEGRFGRPLTASHQAWTGLPQGWPIGRAHV